MRKAYILALGAMAAHAATFGKVTPLIGGASDIVLDEARSQLYLTAPVPNQVQVYSLKQAKFLAPITTDQTPLSAAISRDGNSLYVVCYDSATLDVINLNTLTVSAQLTLPAKAEGVAVDSNGLVLISTVGSANGTANLLMLYNPSPTAKSALTSIPVTPAAPGLPTFPPTSGRPFLAKHSQLVASRDGSVVVGANAPVNGTTTGTATLFVYQAASASVPSARIVTGNSTTLAVSDDGTRIMCGPVLYDAATLQVLAQQTGANAPYPLTTTVATYTTQTNQGGAVFVPGGQTLYAAWNIAPPSNTTTTPGTTPPASNITQLLSNDPDNLLINMGIQLPENLAGRMVISSDGTNAYALSDSGFITLPLSTLTQSPIAVPASRVAMVTSDPCGVTAATGTATIAMTNQGKGSFSVSAQVYSTTTTVGFGPGGPGTTTTAAAPAVRSTQAGGSPALVFSFNSAESKIRGTVSPPSDFLVTSNEAVNIPPSVRVYENSRDSEARASVMTIPLGPNAPATDPFPDLVYDQPRQRLYIANNTMNRVEVYDIKSKAFLTPVKVGQTPVSMALSLDGGTLYVGNSGGESISIVDTAALQNTGRVAFPPLPFASNLTLVTPNLLAMGLSGLQFVTNDGTLWKVVGNAAVVRPSSKLLGTNKITSVGSMVATPAGEYILTTTTTGFAYLYDATLDDFATGRQVLTGTQITGYVGPVTAGPGGAYYVMNGVLLDSNLETVNGTTGSGAVSAVAAATATSYAYFTPVAATSTTAPAISLADSRTGSAMSQFSALEGPLTQTTAIGPGGGRTSTNGRTMSVDSTGAAAYMISVSGLSIIPLTTVPAAQKPVVSRGGAVNLASYQSAVAVNGLLSIFGSNLGSTAQAATVPLPTTLGGTCVTLNNVPVPLFLMSPGQINAQIPPNLAAGTYPLVIHSIANQAASTSQNITVSKVAPAVFVDGSGNALLYHANGSQVTQNNPATRDEPLTMYATGLGATTGGTVTTGMPSPSSPLAVVSGVQVFFGDPSYTQAAIIVDWAGLAPGLIGVYQLNLQIPGFHINGNSLPITLRVGTVNSPTTGVVVPTVSVN
jgi:uncharacterized protein (TIGR03437 family)